jgi:hypothetical protein
MRTWTGFTLVAGLLSLAQLAAAQASGEGRFDDATACKGSVASRLSSDIDCGEITRESREPIVVRTELEGPPLVVSLPDVVINNCEATIQFEYTQRGSTARVSGEIENPTCAASAGTFTVSLRTSNDNFEQTTLDFAESWQRDDDQPVAFSRDYPIGDGVDLIRVRTSKAVCKCTAAE